MQSRIEIRDPFFDEDSAADGVRMERDGHRDGVAAGYPELTRRAQVVARLEQELRKGPLAHGFAGDQRWTLGRIKTLIGKLFHVGYTAEGVWKLMRRHGWSCQVPVRQALERDDEAVAVWKDQVWPDIKALRDLGAYVCFEDEAGRDLILAAHRSLSAPLVWC
jgi:transposase